MTLSFYQHSTSPMNKASIGKQAHQLTTLLDAGFPVPKGFIVSPDTCKAFFSHGRLHEKIQLLLERCNFHDPEDIARVSKNIQRLIASAEMPEEAARSLLEACTKISGERVMLTASPVGVLATETNVTHRLYGLEGEANILLGIRQLWASPFKADELFSIYMSEQTQFPTMAICVQVQPKAIVSGVLYTTDGADKKACMIQAVWGEGAYQHKLQGADTYWIEKHSGNELSITRNIQVKEFGWEHAKLESVETPASRQKKQKLSSDVLKQLGSLAKEVQQKLFFPQEVVFVSDGKRVYIIETHQASVAVRTNEHVPTPQTKRVLLKGVGGSPGIITGMVHVVSGPHDTHVHPGDIVVAKSLSDIATNALRSAKGIIVEEETQASAIMDLAQKGIALLMSATGAVDLLEPGSFVTLHTPRGEVLAGGYTVIPHAVASEPKGPPPSATHIGTIFSLGDTLRVQPGTISGHMVLSPHRLIKNIGVHPLKLVRTRAGGQLSHPIAAALTQACTQFPSAAFLYSFSHLTSDEYAPLQGGSLYETQEEHNPLMGYMGATRILQNPDLILPEMEAVSQVHKASYGKHLSLLLPPARSSHEVRALGELLAHHGLSRSASCRHFVDISIPSLLWDLAAVAPYADGVILNLDSIYAHLFAHDPTVDAIRLQSVDIEPGLFAILEQAHTVCTEQGIRLIVRGSLMQHDAFLAFVVQKGITEVMVPQRSVDIVRQRVSTLEQERIAYV